ncbi:MAG TPA: transglycosylase domain-containing protein [Candidatus Paceibacterota bacterium]|nr:transglycosylase domain-containing protein [Candidatus Paceibacterota bacterium]
MKWTVTPITSRRRFTWPSARQWGHFLLWIVVLGAIAGFSLFIYLERTLPDPESIATRRVSESTKIYDRTGQVLLYDIHGDEKRTIIAWEDMPESAREATLAAEDGSFYQHGGFDIKGILRSLFVDLKTLSFDQGGSTITQQLVGNALTGRQKTPLRKIQELILSVEVEKKFTKDQILWMYLNEIPYGSNIYGIEAASKAFFGKSASDLTIAESATLASIIQRPTYYSPYGSHVDELMARKNMVLGRMKDLGFISPDEYQAAMDEQLAFKKSTESITAPHFVIMVKDYVVKKYGEDAVENGGLKIITTLDANLQELASKSVNKYVPINEKQYKASNAALVSVDPKTGDVLALIGSRDYFDIEHDGNFNVAVDGPGRQPGSSFKPFAYATLFQKGYPDSTVLIDARTEFNPNCPADGSGKKDQYGLDCYHPQNYDSQYRGPVSLRQALDQSLNVPAVKVLYLAGIQNTIDLASAMGISTLTNPKNYGLSLVLGGAEVHPIDLVSAYGVFANDGVRNPWHIVNEIQDANGNILEKAQDQSQRVLDSQTARLIDNVLSDNSARAPVFGYNNSLYIPGYDVAAKTGTTQDNHDGWVVGFSPNIATVVWTGNNDNSPMTAAGAGISAAGPMWHDFMVGALQKLPNTSFPEPAPVTSSKIMLNGEYTDISTGTPQINTILQYVDPSDPLGPVPFNPQTNEQYNNWEWAVRRLFGEQ